MSRRVLHVLLGLAVPAVVAAVGAASGGAGPLGERLAAYLDEVRSAAAEREHELREALGLDGSHDAVDAHL